MENKLYTKLFYLSIVLLFVNLIIRFIDQAKLLYRFPLGYNNDISSYLTQLYFLKTCGFHNICTYWYNGFINFLHSPPGWYLFTLPIYSLSKDVKIAAYVSMLLSFLLAFIIIWNLYSKLKFNKISRLLFFIFTFGNAVAVGNFVRLGRYHELLAWVLFILFLFLIYWYKERTIDRNILLLSLVYTLITITYHSVAVISGVLFAALFLIKKGKERIYVLLSFLFSLLLSAFWWLPFLLRIKESSILQLNQGGWLLNFSKNWLITNIITMILPLIFIILFYLYYKKSKKDFSFYLPILIFSLLLITRIIAFLPIYNNIFPDPYIIFFVILILFILIYHPEIGLMNNKIFILAFTFIIIMSLILTLVKTPYYEQNTLLKTEFLDLTKYLKQGRVAIYGNNFGSEISANAMYSYIPIYTNVSVPLGWYPEVKNLDYIDNYYKFLNNINESSCDNIIYNSKIYNITEYISYLDSCNIFSRCKDLESVKNGNICLYSIKI